MYCIYRITNIINGKTYIGKHKYIDESNPMGRYKGSGKLLHKAYKKYGIENFKTEILYSRIRDIDTVNAMETWSISKYKPEYNIAKGGDGGPIRLGMHRPFTEEHKRKLSEAAKNRGYSSKQIDAMAQANKGKHRPDDVKLKISQKLIGHIGANKGKKLGPRSDETKAKLSASHTGKHWKLVDGKRTWY